MLLRRLSHDALAQAGYLIACQASKEAIVIDPLRDPGPYLDAARREGVRITMVTETHVHADFLSGARHIPLAELSARLHELRDAGPQLVHCQGGSRRAVAASVRLAAGFPDVSNVEGGYAAWQRAGYAPEPGG